MTLAISGLNRSMISFAFALALSACGSGGSGESGSGEEETHPVPEVALSAQPSTIVAGASAKLTWNTTNATSCAASGGWTGDQSISGTANVQPSITTSYTLLCSGEGGNASATATIIVTAAAPTLTLTAEPSAITAGESSTLTWSSSDATTCIASGGWDGTQPLSGHTDVQPSITTRYTLVCSGDGGNASSIVTISVSPPSHTALYTPQRIIARAMLGSLRSLTSSLTAGDAAKVARNLKISSVSPYAKSTVYPCDYGTETYEDPQIINVHSPYSNESFIGTPVLYDKCRYAGPDSSFSTIDGPAIYACPRSSSTDGMSCVSAEDGNELVNPQYRKIGLPDVPYVVTYGTKENGTEAIQREVQYLDTQLHDLFVENADGISGRSRFEEQAITHKLTRLPINGVLQLQADYTNGTAENPAITRETEYEDGRVEYEHNGTESFRAVDCDLGVYEVHTVEPIQYVKDPDTGSPRSISHGIVEFTQDGETASLTFNANGSLTVIDSTSKATTYSTAAELQSALGTCAKYL